MLRKDDDDWVKKCMEYEVEGSRPKKTWKEVVREDCQARKLNDQDGCERVNVSSGTGLTGLSQTNGR